MNIDANPNNADWTKQSWDIPANSLDELRQWLASQELTVEQFKALPVYRFNIKKLAWLAEL